MKFVVKKEDLYNGIKIVERATSMKALQPVLLNILIETVDKGTIKLVATDLDFTVIALVDAQVEEEGKITLPSKTLNEIVSKLSDKLITFDMNKMEVLKNEEVINLSSLELKILHLLFSNLNKVVTRNEIIDKVWEWTGNDIYDNTVTVYMKRIREKLQEDIICTIKGIGYRIDEK